VSASATSVASPQPRDLIVIRPSGGAVVPRIRDAWRHRELFYFLVWRDVKVRYAQTLLGGLWTVFQPLAMMLVYTYAFTRLARLDTGSIPYPLFALSGLVLWTFVSRAVVQGSSSLVNDIPLVTRTYAPRLVIPLSAVVSMFVDFLISLALFLVFAAAYGRVPGWRVVAVPPILAATFVLALGVSLFLSALNVKYRDVGQALPFLVQLWFFLSPVAYSLHTPGLSWETIVQAANPMVGLIEAMRWALLGTAAPHGLLIVAVALACLSFLGGLLYFGRADRSLADDV
jgi:lipopolysaccharide transport system permease protein